MVYEMLCQVWYYGNTGHPHNYPCLKARSMWCMKCCARFSTRGGQEVSLMVAYQELPNEKHQRDLSHL